MADPWMPIVALAGTLLPLFGAKRWITRRLQELSMRWVGDPDVALILYFVVVLPGVVIHEVSHWLAARVLGVRVTRFSIGPVRGRGQRVSLGSIRVGKVDVVRGSLIGIAPLVGGSAVILLIGMLVLGVDEIAGAVAGQGVDGILAGLGQMARTADFGLWLYLIFAVSNAMLPSDSDMATVRPVLLFLGVVTAVVLIVVGVPQIPPNVTATVDTVATYLAYAFGLTLAVDAIFMVLIGVLTGLTRWWQDRPTYHTE
jgi:membrane-associated protease RseP (regulator of RpoE activity)